ncbi:hypothetical protein V6x_52300 [Gimesia chilikensis]|uniref:Hemerythrin-like domain-containing protein n=2 Tax=Gimesia TaxID=1649453 RepID=A0A6I6AHT2_9PLAN|nr:MULTISPECIES: hypothetical protein [Gimesia]QDU05493.1 hypothetical protein V6x_52300 [Gimesia chilikensis]QGQ24681.1 hypothetical protein F1728_19185 [Gimesia benthica]
MITQRPNITVNAAFLQEIKDNNLQLDELLELLNTLCSVNDKTFLEPKRFSELIHELRDLLAMHFSLEDALGYFIGPSNIIPVLSKEATRLKSQHEELYLEVSAIAENADTLLASEHSENVSTNLIRRFRSFYEDLRKHESEEYDLILIAYYEEPCFNAATHLVH